jgi:hypothetical protein
VNKNIGAENNFVPASNFGFPPAHSLIMVFSSSLAKAFSFKPGLEEKIRLELSRKIDFTSSSCGSWTKKH